MKYLIVTVLLLLIVSLIAIYRSAPADKYFAKAVDSPAKAKSDIVYPEYAVDDPLSDSNKDKVREKTPVIKSTFDMTAIDSGVNEDVDIDMQMEIEEKAYLMSEWDQNHKSPEPNDYNSDMPSEGPFKDAVELINMGDACTDNCAEALNELALSEGDFADQVNTDSLKELAVVEGLIDEFPSIPLVESDESLGPPSGPAY